MIGRNTRLNRWRGMYEGIRGAGSCYSGAGWPDGRQGDFYCNNCGREDDQREAYGDDTTPRGSRAQVLTYPWRFTHEPDGTESYQRLVLRDIIGRNVR